LTAYDTTLRVSVIVVNWNGRAYLERCLRSLAAQTLAAHEVVVVDNGSSDGSVDVLRDRGAVRLVALPSNVGYGAALNAGMRVARGQYLLALNNDTELAPNCLHALVSAADRHPNSGLFAPKILSADPPHRIDTVGHLLYPDGLSRGRGRLEEDRGQYDHEDDLLLPSGCAVLLRRAMLADVGVFDEDLFAYCEDTDLGLRAQLAGWRCTAVPTAVVYHAYSASTAHYSPLKAFLVERNRAWVAAKCLPLPLLLLSPVFTLLRLSAQAYGALTHRGAAGRFAAEQSRGALLGVLVRALAAATTGLPHALRKRRVVQARRRVASAELRHWVTRHGMGLREIALKD
jgi:hypothetical protein